MRSELEMDMAAIVRVMRSKPWPWLHSELWDACGKPGEASYIWPAFDAMLFAQLLESAFPEARPGDSGRQFFVLSAYPIRHRPAALDKPPGPAQRPPSRKVAPTPLCEPRPASSPPPEAGGPPGSAFAIWLRRSARTIAKSPRK